LMSRARCHSSNHLTRSSLDAPTFLPV
jgi:hypothetical protein